MEPYTGIAAEAEADFIEKKSRFIGSIKPTASEAEAKQFIEAVRAAHREANHHVYAFCIGADIMRSNDDGEPSGTAGRPVLEAIKKAGLQNVALVVTRYFGGTLLGAGGLTRAYGRAAQLAIEQARPVRYLPAELTALHFDYALIGRVEALLAEHGAEIRDRSYAETVCFLAAIPLVSLDGLSRTLSEASNGALRLQGLTERMYVTDDK